MSKFRLTKNDNKEGEHILAYQRSDGTDYFVFDSADLSDLASCVSSALAEQNSRVMSEEEDCRKCDNHGWYVENLFDDAGRFLAPWRHDGCEACGRTPNKSATQSTDQAPSTRTEG